MAAAPRPNEARRLRRSARSDRRRRSVIPQGRSSQPSSPSSRSPRTVIRVPFLARRKPTTAQKDGSARIASLPAPTPDPQWLGQMRRVYRWSSVTVFGMGIAVAGVYSQTVRLEQELGQTYTHLQNLQRQERELTVAMEQLKDQIARQAAQPESGLALPKPTDQVFLTPSPPPQAQQQPRPNAAPVPPKRDIPDTPVGY